MPLHIEIKSDEIDQYYLKAEKLEEIVDEARGNHLTQAQIYKTIGILMEQKFFADAIIANGWNFNGIYFPLSVLGILSDYAKKYDNSIRRLDRAADYVTSYDDGSVTGLPDHLEENRLDELVVRYNRTENTVVMNINDILKLLGKLIEHMQQPNTITELIVLRPTEPVVTNVTNHPQIEPVITID